MSISPLRVLRDKPSRLTVLVFGLVGACDWFVAPDVELARIIVQGDPDAQVRVITSARFLVAGTGAQDTVRVQLLDADTARRSLPFSATHDIGETQRFFVRVSGADATRSEVHLRVLLDGKERFSESSNPLEDPLQFIYVLNQRTTGPILVF